MIELQSQARRQQNPQGGLEYCSSMPKEHKTFPSSTWNGQRQSLQLPPAPHPPWTTNSRQRSPTPPPPSALFYSPHGLCIQE